MTDHSTTPGVAHRFGEDWPSDADAFRAVKDYLANPPEQGDWSDDDHLDGIAGGVLSALGRAGYLSVKGEPPDAHLWDLSLYGRTE